MLVVATDDLEVTGLVVAGREMAGFLVVFAGGAGKGSGTIASPISRLTAAPLSARKRAANPPALPERSSSCVDSSTLPTAPYACDSPVGTAGRALGVFGRGFRLPATEGAAGVALVRVDPRVRRAGVSDILRVMEIINPRCKQS